MNLNVYTDGGSRGNPGPAAIGVVVKDEADKIIARFGRTIGTTTNNQAEYRAVMAALQWLVKHQQKAKTVFYLDSALVVNQLNGLWKIKDAGLRRQLIRARQLEAGLGFAPHYRLIPRSKNIQADQLVNLSLDKNPL